MADSPWSILSPWSQTIGRFINEPVTNWQRFFNPQVVFNYNPQDEPVEAHVLSRVGSYGSQLGKLIDVIDILQRSLDRSILTAPQREALTAFDRLRDSAEQAVDDFRGRIGADDIVAAAAALRKRDPAAAGVLRDKLNLTLGDEQSR